MASPSLPYNEQDYLSDYVHGSGTLATQYRRDFTSDHLEKRGIGKASSRWQNLDHLETRHEPRRRDQGSTTTMAISRKPSLPLGRHERGPDDWKIVQDTLDYGPEYPQGGSHTERRDDARKPDLSSAPLIEQEEGSTGERTVTAPEFDSYETDFDPHNLEDESDLGIFAPLTAALESEFRTFSKDVQAGASVSPSDANRTFEAITKRLRKDREV